MPAGAYIAYVREYGSSEPEVFVFKNSPTMNDIRILYAQKYGFSELSDMVMYLTADIVYMEFSDRE